MRASTIALLAVAFSVTAAAARAESPTCAALLTAAELEAAAGKGFEDMGPSRSGVGHTECSWMSRAGGFKIVALTFWDADGVRDEIESDGGPAELFEIQVKSMEEVGGGKREPIAGVGGGAVLLKNAEQLVAFLPTSGGLARVVANGLTRAQVTALAKAVAGAPVAGAAAIPTTERIQGAAILAHPVGAVALDYARRLHAKGGDVAALSSRAAQAKRKAMPKDERAESDAFVRGMVPAADALDAAIRAGGVLLVEGPKATLNLVRTETSKNADGSVTSSSSTAAIPFEMEDGAWKVAR